MAMGSSNRPYSIAGDGFTVATSIYRSMMQYLAEDDQFWYRTEGLHMVITSSRMGHVATDSSQPRKFDYREALAQVQLQQLKGKLK